MKSRTSLVAAVLVSVTFTWSLLAQQSAPAAPQRPADSVVAGAPAIDLDIPATVFAAQTVLRRVLDAAGVRYGLESPAVDPNVPPIDFARRREDTLKLSGRRLGDALDAITNAVPEFRWTDIDGVIIVRSAPAGQGILDREIDRFAVTDAAPRPALEALVAAIDPARPRGVGMVGFGRTAAGAISSSTKVGRNVTLNLRNASVLTILTSIARSNGAMSWSVQYDRVPASLQTASITFTEGTETVTAQSPVLFNTPITSGPSTQRLTIGSSMSATLSNYTLRAPVKISVEEVGASFDTEGAASLAMLLPTGTSRLGLPALELPDAPAQAIARIVALDSRYEWSESKGHFHVRPRAGVPGRIDLLDTTINGFTASNESARTVIERLCRTIGTVRPTAPSPAMAGRPGEVAMATPISINLAGSVTVRDVLDGIADVTGWNWSFRPTFLPGVNSRLDLEWRALSAPGSIANWSTSIGITAFENLSPAPLPTRASGGAFLATLDRDISRVTVTFEPGPGPFQQLAQEARVPLTVEESPSPPAPQDPRRMTRPRVPISVGPGKFSDAVYVLLEKVPGYYMDSSDGMVNVMASALKQSSSYFMDRPLAAFSVTNVGLFRAVGELRRALDPTFEPRDWPGGGGEILNRAVSLSVRDTTPRVILNKLVSQHGEVTWASRFAPRDGADRAATRIQDWILTLTTISVEGPIVSLTANGGVPASSLLPPPTPAVRVPTRSVLLDLPVTALSLRVALGAAGKTMGVPLGFEGITLTTPPSIERSAEYYDLTGLQGEELVNKFRELAPDYEFSLTNGVYHVRPRVTQNDTTAWLDQRIDRFEQRFESLRDAHVALASIRLQSSLGGRGGPPPSLPRPSALDERLKKTLNISLTNTTVRDLLDEIARQFGSMMWSVDSRMTAQGTTMTLTFSGFDGWSIGTGIR